MLELYNELVGDTVYVHNFMNSAPRIEV